jgi:hypothetical protein
MDFELVLQNSLVYGTILSLGLSLLILASLYLNAEMWLGDYPSDIQEKYGEMGEKAKSQRIVVAILFFLVAIGLIVISNAELAEVLGGDVRFLEVFLNTFIMLLLFNLVDLLILDWLVFVAIQPKFIVLPRTEGMAGYKDYRFHFVAFMKGLILILVASLVTAGIALLIQSI